MATVIGPTPPGTGVIADAFAATSSKATSPQSLPFSSRLIPTSITTAPRLNHVWGNKAGLTDCRDKYIGLTSIAREVLRLRVAYGNGGVRMQKHKGKWLAYDIAAPDNDAVLPAYVSQQMEDSGLRPASPVKSFPIL